MVELLIAASWLGVGFGLGAAIGFTIYCCTKNRTLAGTDGKHGIFTIMMMIAFLMTMGHMVFGTNVPTEFLLKVVDRAYWSGMAAAFFYGCIVGLCDDTTRYHQRRQQEQLRRHKERLPFLAPQLLDEVV